MDNNITSTWLVVSLVVNAVLLVLLAWAQNRNDKLETYIDDLLSADVWYEGEEYTGYPTIATAGDHVVEHEVDRYPVPLPTIGELAEGARQLGLIDVYDTALPAQWVLDVHDKTGVWPTEFVWSYPPGSVWGEPFPLTKTSTDLLDRYNAAIGQYA